jgi:hypothetical protein
VLRHESTDVSTIDLFAGKWVLLHGPKGGAWRDLLAGNRAFASLQAVCYGIAPDGTLEDVKGRWPSLYNLDDDGAVLIRPDGIVAWRAQNAGDSAQTAFATVLDVVLPAPVTVAAR